MIENQDIAQGAVSKTKLSKNLRLDLTNLPKGTVGQIPIVQADGNWGLVNLSGDISIAADGTTTVVNNATINAADIDTAFNFLTDQRGFVFRKGQQDYTVDDKNYATEIVAATHADHAATTSALVKRFTHNLIWGASHTSTNYPSGTAPDYNSLVSINHNLDTNYIVGSVADVDGTIKSAGEQMDMNFEDEVLLKVTSSNSITLEFNHLPALNEEYYVTIIGTV